MAYQDLINALTRHGVNVGSPAVGGGQAEPASPTPGVTPSYYRNYPGYSAMAQAGQGQPSASQPGKSGFLSGKLGRGVMPPLMLQGPRVGSPKEATVAAVDPRMLWAGR